MMRRGAERDHRATPAEPVGERLIQFERQKQQVFLGAPDDERQWEAAIIDAECTAITGVGKGTDRVQPSAGGTQGMLWISIPSSASVSASSGVVSP
jgi:hypothetical protein